MILESKQPTLICNRSILMLTRWSHPAGVKSASGVLNLAGDFRGEVLAVGFSELSVEGVVSDHTCLAASGVSLHGDFLGEVRMDSGLATSAGDSIILGWMFSSFSSTSGRHLSRLERTGCGDLTASSSRVRPSVGIPLSFASARRCSIDHFSNWNSLHKVRRERRKAKLSQS